MPSSFYNKYKHSLVSEFYKNLFFCKMLQFQEFWSRTSCFLCPQRRLPVDIEIYTEMVLPMYITHLRLEYLEREDCLCFEILKNRDFIEIIYCKIWQYDLRVWILKSSKIYMYANSQVFPFTWHVTLNSAESEIDGIGVVLSMKFKVKCRREDFKFIMSSLASWFVQLHLWIK